MNMEEEAKLFERLDRIDEALDSIEKNMKRINELESKNSMLSAQIEQIGIKVKKLWKIIIA